jgi:RNA polymerase sigma-70 factor (ECF subfamily)
MTLPENMSPQSSEGDVSSSNHSDRIATIFREHNESLLRFLAARLGSNDDAMEVAQEAYVRLLKLDKPEGVSFLKAFLFKTASNLAIDRVRHRRSKQRSDHLFFNLGCDSQPSVEQNLSVAEDASLTMRALSELPERCRTAFLLNRLDGLSTLEIATRLGVSDRAVRKYLVRALEHVHQSMHSDIKTGTNR